MGDRSFLMPFLNMADAANKYVGKKIVDTLVPKRAAAPVTPAPAAPVAPAGQESIPLGAGLAQNAADIIQKKKKEQEGVLSQM